ncbi:unnamed protein product [Phaedon cochleariae]|uniref:DNA polymerase delta small subunit n=1 Tax=Phaedon cochleariae TaxID=80249 RepID=A0A9P0DSZ7_PHACE|nr:unnamed protein product [Phaedon cochleariae]
MKSNTNGTTRRSLGYENTSQIFLNKKYDYNKQYCSIYLARLQEMEVLLMERVSSKWGDKYPIGKLHKLSDENTEKCVVIGTLFKDQKLKPSILKQLTEPSVIVNTIHFTDGSDKLFIEDEIQRFELLGSIDLKYVVTGISCALLGTSMGKGKFMVNDYLFPGYRNQVERPIFNDSAFVIFLSGIDFIHHEHYMPNLQLLSCWISGMLGDVDIVSKVTRIIIAGNSIKSSSEKHNPEISIITRRTESTETIEAVASFDKFLSQLCQLVDIDLMPGENDPSNHILPQREMHHCMFPLSTIFKSLHCVTNPYSFSLDGLKILGTSGQPVRDIMRYSEITESIDAMESCFKWSHLAPTAPDTLGCFPCYDKDPFIIEECPHVFFSGNQKEFSTKMILGEEGQKVRLISIPEFSKTFEAAILDLKSLECSRIVFDKS